MVPTERYEVRPASLGLFVAWDTESDQPVYLPGRSLEAETSERSAQQAVTLLNRAYAGVRRRTNPVSV